MNENIEKYAIVAGAVGTIALVYFATKSGSGSGSGGASSGVPMVLRSVTPETVQLRGIAAGVETAALNAKVEAMKIFAGFELGLDTNATGERVTKYVSDNNLTLGKEQARVALETSQIESEAAKYSVERLTWAQQQQAHYAYLQTQQQEKSKRTGSVASTIGSIALGFLKFI